MSKIFDYLGIANRDIAIEIKDELELFELNLVMLGYTDVTYEYDTYLAYEVHIQGEKLYCMRCEFYIFGISELLFIHQKGLVTEKNKVQIESFKDRMYNDWISSVREMNRYLLEVIV
ncbi:hypothetical protein D3C87_81160 [compost metagenome]